jgi:hypothetical protein
MLTAAPATAPLRRYSDAEQEEIAKQIQELIEKGFIQPSTSPFGASCAVCAQEGWHLAHVH